MDLLPTLYTETTECRDCYKCLRQCAVKAIHIRDGHANIASDLCVGCGHCVEICPVGAKKVRDDIGRVRLLLKMKKKVIVSLAPSYVTEFKGIPKETLVGALKQLGFYGVSETALGAQEVSAAVSGMMDDTAKRVHISSACPTVVEIVKKYYPQYAGLVTDLLSPVLAHTKLLRQQYGDDIAIVFIGPCISKKLEADSHRDLLDVALSFEEFRRWLQEEGIDLAVNCENSNNSFIPYDAEEGAIYPVDGGMIAGIKANCEVNDNHFMAFSGMDNIRRILDDITDINADKPVFIELLACEGGCVNGPMSASRTGTIVKRIDVLNSAHYPDNNKARIPSVDVTTTWDIEKIVQTVYSEDELSGALEKVGKFTREDEMNCGGCGYDSCREFAHALLDDTAEPNMCMGYMRKLAMKKANALIQTMPSGVVIVNKKLRIVESNKRFAQIMGSDTELVYEARPGLEHADLKKIAPFYNYFKSVIDDGAETVDLDIRYKDSILHLSVFSIEAHQLVGGILQDITVPAVQKERIVNKAKDVIQKNLETVQKIAYLLGENAADSEVILNSIIDSFPTETLDGAK